MELCAKVMQLSSSEPDDSLKTVENEIKALTLLNHPNIIRVYEHFQNQSHFFLILELCRGGSLQREVSNGKGLPLERFRLLGRQILSALTYSHSKGIAHHDIKLGNVLLDEYGRPKLADFGICVMTSKTGELTDQYAGSVQYESPEILNKKLHDPFKSDVWALGVLFAHMITGTNPFHGDTMGKLKSSILRGVYSLKKSTPPEVANMISRMIRLDPDERVTMAELNRLPLFQDAQPPSTGGIVDCLHPCGRRQMQTIAIAVETEGNVATEDQEFMTGYRPTKEMTLETSTTLTITQWNIARGFVQLLRLPARYPSSTKMPTFGEPP
jgi:serine/threonine protein kinase